MCFQVVDTAYVLAPFVDNWNFKAAESLGSRAINQAGLFSVTMAWDAGLEVPIVQGMPYVTLNYNGLTPVFETIHAIISINGVNDDSPVTDTRFEVELNNGQTWIVYASSDVTFTRSGGVMTASGAFTGSLRAAAVIDGVNVADLDDHSAAIPTGGTVSASSSGDSATLTFNWEKTGSGDLFMMALPHHLDVLTVGIVTTTHYNTIKGDMFGVIGDSWSLEEDLTTIDWFAPQGIDSSRLDAIKEALNGDIDTEVLANDPYFGGKQMARIARLAVIAEEAGESALAATYRDKVRPTLESWLEGTNSDPLVYDQTWGGICSFDGLVDGNADFGQGYYNDHHFHYGYHIYAAAVLAKADSAWADQYNEQVMHLIRDITEPSGADPYYTQTRYCWFWYTSGACAFYDNDNITCSRPKDWYAGHSWANGIAVAFGDSHNQESTSESVHAWYAVYLYGVAVGNDRVRDLGRLQLATEIRGAQKYWQIMSQDAIYPAPFATTKWWGSCGAPRWTTPPGSAETPSSSTASRCCHSSP